MGIYVRPTGIDEAVAALAGRRLAILAGGTDFYPSRVGRALDDDVLDIGAISSLRGIAEEARQYRIGATTRWSDIVAADLPPWFAGLKLAAREVGGAQIQNAGTVGGNLCNASPAADGVPMLLALDAAVELVSTAGRRRLPLAEFIAGNRRTLRRPDELIAAILVPKPLQPGTRSTFLKLGARRYLVISIAMVGAVLEVAGSTVAAARIAVGACSAVAERLPLLEADLVGRALAPGIGGAVRPEHLAHLSPIDDVRGTAEYRRDAALILVVRALERLAGGTP
jgi:CO/xanthine dehydrogenase FAD-binding subunit